MKIKGEYVLRTVAGTDIVIPIGGSIADFNGVISLNETGSFLWKALREDTDEASLVKALTQEYDVPSEEALADVREFLEVIRSNNMLETSGV